MFVSELLRASCADAPNRTRGTLNRLAAGLGVSPDEFFGPAHCQRGPADERIHRQIDDLLANGQRNLLMAVVEALYRSTQSQELPRGEPLAKRHTVDARCSRVEVVRVNSIASVPASESKYGAQLQDPA